MDSTEVGTASRTLQATVRAFEPSGGTGSVFTDEGIEYPFDRDVLSARIHHLRIGQRVRIELENDRLVRLQMVTLPDD